MIKTAFAAAAAAAAFAAPGAALAGPSVNVETNAGWTGRITLARRQISMWHEGPIGESASYYVQAGASLVTPDGGTDETVPSGKAGVGVALSDALGAYGEVSFVGSGDSDIDRGYGAKLGLKYSF